VTEAWEPNIALCRERLEPLGITVRRGLPDFSLPFEDGSFDVVINRHESYDMKEVARVLKRGGWFVTQQVGEKNNEILSQKLIEGFSPRYTGHNLSNCMMKIKESGFNIQYAEECFPESRFNDVGAIVYLAKIIEWEFPGFSVEKCFDRLCGLQEELILNKWVKSREHRFAISARFM
jgi:SAM-dependent methyltransferase